MWNPFRRKSKGDCVNCVSYECNPHFEPFCRRTIKTTITHNIITGRDDEHVTGPKLCRNERCCDGRRGGCGKRGKYFIDKRKFK